MRRNDFIDGILTLQRQMYAADLRDNDYPTITLEFPTLEVQENFRRQVMRDTNINEAVGCGMLQFREEALAAGVFAIVSGIKVKLEHAEKRFAGAADALAVLKQAILHNPHATIDEMRQAGLSHGTLNLVLQELKGGAR